MQSIHPLRRARLFRFGRGRRYILDMPSVAATGWIDDLKLFAATFIGGFLFVAIYLG